MPLTTSEKIKIILKRRGMTLKELSARLDQKSSNLSNKLSRNNFPEKEIKEIADALGCEYEAYFVMRDTGEKL
ncbi:helix-turn-helix domain-containing protein [Clostridiales bacterium]|nr:helix-turn-helix domain-containing protein [Clostridiales bacterium]